MQPPDSLLPTARLHARFLSLLPRIERHGRVCFRNLRCPVQKEEVIAEVIALAWLWFVQLTRRGKDATAFGSALAGYAARAVHCGRRVCGQETPRDPLSPLAQRRRGFPVRSLPATSRLEGPPPVEALQTTRQTPGPEQVSFRCAFPAWLRTRADRDRRLALDLMAGERTQDVSDRYGLSAARVSQLRRDFHDDWRRFTGDDEPRAETRPTASV